MPSIPDENNLPQLLPAIVALKQGLSLNLKTACPIPKFLPINIYLLSYFQSLFQLHLIAYCVKRAIYTSAMSSKNVSQGKIWLLPQNVKIEYKILYRNFRQSKKK